MGNFQTYPTYDGIIFVADKQSIIACHEKVLKIFRLTGHCIDHQSAVPANRLLKPGETVDSITIPTNQYGLLVCHDMATVRNILDQTFWTCKPVESISEHMLAMVHQESLLIIAVHQATESGKLAAQAELDAFHKDMKNHIETAIV